jgi:hypothetical protein
MQPTIGQPTIGEAAPTPRPIRATERWRAAWHGRRDAKHLSADADQPQPYLESLRAQAEIGQRAVNGWLHNKIDPIDREAIQVLILLDQHRRDPAIPPDATPTKPATDDTDPQPQARIPPRVLKAREAAAAQMAYQRWVHEQNEAEQRLGQLGSARHHLIEVGRAAANAHVARYQHLVGLYHTALLRRDPGRHRTGPPPTVGAEPWLHGDMPLLALEIDGSLAEDYCWRLKDFASRTSAVTLPVRDVTPNPN